MQCDAMLCDAMQRTSVSARRLRSRLCNNVHSFGGREEKERHERVLLPGYCTACLHLSLFRQQEVRCRGRACCTHGRVNHIALHCVALHRSEKRKDAPDATTPTSTPRPHLLSTEACRKCAVDVVEVADIDVGAHTVKNPRCRTEPGPAAGQARVPVLLHAATASAMWTS